MKVSELRLLLLKVPANMLRLGAIYVPGIYYLPFIGNDNEWNGRVLCYKGLGKGELIIVLSGNQYLQAIAKLLHFLLLLISQVVSQLISIVQGGADDAERY